MKIDNNVADVAPFVKAQEEICGENKSFPLVAFGTLKAKSAFKLLCNARKDIPVTLQNEMTSIINDYEKEYLYASDEDREEMDLKDYIDDPDLLKLYHEGEKYFGVTSDLKRHASAFCISNINLRREFGLCQTPKGDIVLNLEGKYMDTFGLVKLDWLIVDVVSIIDKVYKKIGIPTPTTNELYELVKNDEATWKIYHEGMTCCVNQMEKAKTKIKCMSYKPTTVEELAALIAAIRPAFISYWKKFEKREEVKFGLEILDKLLQGEFLDSSYILYQEQVMMIFQWLGFEMKTTYDVMKAISKKKEETIKAVKGKFMEMCQQAFIDDGKSPEEALEQTEHIWKVIEDSSKYSFNAAHALCMAFDSLYIAYAKAHYPEETYVALIDYYSTNKKQDKVYMLQIEANRLGMSVEPLKFRQDNRETTIENKSIYTSLSSVKGINDNDAVILYNLRNHKGTFLELVSLMQKEGIDAGKIKKLVKVHYFDEYGSVARLLWIVTKLKTMTIKMLKADKIEQIYHMVKDNLSAPELLTLLKENATKVNPKSMNFDDDKKVFTIIQKYVTIPDIINLEDLYNQAKLLGTLIDKECETNICKAVQVKEQTKSLLLDNLVKGEQFWVNIAHDFKVRKNDIVYIPKITSYTSKKGKVYYNANTLENLSLWFGE